MSKVKRFVMIVLVVALVAMAAVPAVTAQQNSLLANIPINTTLPGGGTFVGTLRITNVAVQNGQLLVSGVLQGVATQGTTVTQINQTFTNIIATLTGSGAGGSCRILVLDIGPINLDLLGLQIDLSPIHLEITAQRGPGNLLGNLLCALAGLLDQGGALTNVLTQLLNQLNNLL